MDTNNDSRGPWCAVPALSVTAKRRMRRGAPSALAAARPDRGIRPRGACVEQPRLQTTYGAVRACTASPARLRPSRTVLLARPTRLSRSGGTWSCSRPARVSTTAERSYGRQGIVPRTYLLRV